MVRALVERAFDAHRALSQHMRIEHGRAHVRMTEQFLYRADVIALFKQVGGEAVPQGVATGRLRYPGLAHGDLHCTLNRFFMLMVPHRTTGIGIGA